MIRSRHVVVEKIASFGQPNCYRLANDEVDLIVSTDFGPRILRYGFLGRENMLGEYPELRTPTQWGDWKPRGGHRLWIAPEEMPLSYAPDNEPIGCEIMRENRLRLAQPTDRAGFEKEITVELAGSGPGVTLHHRITNRTTSAVRIAAWPITIMHGGGFTIIPQEPFRSHDDCLVPARSIVLWHFTDLTDPRLRLGRKFIQLHADALRPEPQKIGAANQQGWCAYYQQDSRTLFVKRTACNPDAIYPDFGANTETYVAGEYIELETLGPLEFLAPGESTTHSEQWLLFSDVQLGASEETMAAAINPLLG